MQIELAHQLARFGITGASRRLDANPVGLAGARGAVGHGLDGSVHRAHIGARVALLNRTCCAWDRIGVGRRHDSLRSEEHTSELQSLMRISYAVFCLKKKKKKNTQKT